MMRALWSAASGMLAQQLNVDNISNNLANVNTTGFKKSRIDFQDLLYQTIRQAGTETAVGTQTPVSLFVGHGVKIVATPRIFTPGDTSQTGNQLDLLVKGDGFFQILQTDGTVAYTRDGSFKKDSTGRVVTSDGLPLEPEIVLPEEATGISVAADGTVSVTLAGQTTQTQVGQLTLAKFINPGGLEGIGGNLFKQTAASGDPVVGTPSQEGFGEISQGFLELSNVQVVEEMVNLILAQRAYEVNSRAILTADDMLSEANNLKR